jgi:WD40 repeat protein
MLILRENPFMPRKTILQNIHKLPSSSWSAAIERAETILRSMAALPWKSAAGLLMTVCLASEWSGLAQNAKAAEQNPSSEPPKAMPSAKQIPARREEKARTDHSGDPLPPGAIARLGTTSFRINDLRGGLAVTPDGKILAIGGRGPLRLVSSATGETIRSIQLPVTVALSVSFSTDGKRFAVIGDHNPTTLFGQHIGRYALLAGEVAGGNILHQFDIECTAVFFSSDGRYLLGLNRRSETANGGPIICWDFQTGKEVWRTGETIACALAPEGSILAGADPRGVVHLWDIASGRECAELKGSTQAIGTLAFSPDGRTLAAAEADGPGAIQGGGPRDYPIHLWDIATRKERRSCQGDSPAMRDMRFSPDGRTLVSADDGSNLYLWDASTGRLRQVFPCPDDLLDGHYAFALSPDSKALIYSQKGGRLFQWDLVAGKEKRHWDTGERSIRDLILTPDGKTLFSRGDSLRIWNLATGSELHVLPAHRTAVRGIRFSPDGKRVASQDEALNLRLWDTATALPIPLANLPSDSRVLVFRFSTDGRWLNALDADATVRVWDAACGKEVRRFRVGNKATIDWWERIVHSDIGDGYSVIGLQEKNVAFHPRQDILAVFREDQHIHLWDLGGGRELHVLNGHRGGLEALDFSPEGETLLSLGEDRTLRLWNLARGEEVQRFAGGRLFAFSPDSQLLAWCEKEVIHLWDRKAQKEVRCLRGHRGGTDRVVFERDSTLLASAGEDRIIRIWDTTTGAEIRAIVGKKEPEVNQFLSRDGRILSFGSSGLKPSGYSLWELSTGAEINLNLFDGFIQSPDGRSLAVVNPRSEFTEKAPLLELWERASWAGVGTLPRIQQGRITCLAFSPGGKVLATGGTDTTMILWDWRRLTGLTHEGTIPITEREIESAWGDLASPDARKGYRAIGTLTASGDRAVTLLRQRLRPAASGDWDRVRTWVADLDRIDFAAREKASRELARLGAEAYPFLRRASTDKVSLEVRRRLEQILASDEIKRLSGYSLRKIRATQVLQGIGTPAARELLAAWSRGDAGAWLTEEARSALRYLQRSPPFP